MKVKHIITTALVTGFTLGFSVSAFAALQGSVNESGINVREAASTDSAKVDMLEEGSQVEILGKEDEWFKVAYDNEYGVYISAEYVTVQNAVGEITSDNVNIRKNPSTSSTIVAAARTGDTVTVVAKDDEWLKIVRTNGDVAYVSADYVKGNMIKYVADFDADDVETEEITSSEGDSATLYAVVTSSSGLNVRSEATTDSSKLELLQPGDVMDVIEAGNKWVKVETASGNIGFVSADYVAVRAGEKPSRGASAKGEAVVEYAKQFLGTPYVWGGTNLSRGVDCSGFVYSVYKHFGINLNRTSRAMASNGVAVSKGNLQPGDLILFDTTGVNDGGISHVGIYIGNDQYIHSSSGKAYSVIITDLYNDYSKRTYVTARRVLR